MPSPRFLDHRRREVEADDVSPARGRGAGSDPGAGADIENTRAGLYARSVQQRPRDLRRQSAERVAVMLRGALPALPFEVVKCVRIHRSRNYTERTAELSGH